MNSIEGNIRIDLYPQRDGDSRVKIQARRPVTASRVLQGKTPRQVLQIVPMMYSVCSTAQARTALQAVSSRMGTDPDPLTEQARDALVWVENAREHLFQILVQWSDLTTTERPTQALALLGAIKPRAALALFSDGRAFELEDHLQPRLDEWRLLIDELDTTLRSEVFGMDTATWMQIEDRQGLLDWAQAGAHSAPALVRDIIARDWSRQGNNRVDPLPELPDAELASLLTGEAADPFVAMPTWHDHCHETSALTRQLEHPLIAALAQDFGHGLLTRVSARLVELAAIPARLRGLAASIENREPTPGNAPAYAGLGATDAARGKLFHYVETDADHISHYRILAPTEWNFHPSGVAAQSLSALEQEDPRQLQHLARLLINAIDPCVSYQLEVH